MYCRDYNMLFLLYALHFTITWTFQLTRRVEKNLDGPKTEAYTTAKSLFGFHRVEAGSGYADLQSDSLQ